MSNQVNRNLSKLTISIEDLHSHEFLLIPAIFSQLKNVNIMTRSNITANDIVDFIAKTECMTNLWVETHMNETKLNELKAILPENWEVWHTIPLLNDVISIEIKM